MNLRDIGGAMPFAHLFGLAPAAPPAPRVQASEDDQDRGPARTTPGAHLAGAPAGPAPAPEAPPAAPPEEDQDAEATATGPAAEARARERARCAAIFASPHAAGRIPMAATLAFTTTLPRAQAIAILASSPAQVAAAPPARPGLDTRMAGLPADANPDPGAGAPEAPAVGADAAAASILASARRARGEPA